MLAAAATPRRPQQEPAPYSGVIHHQITLLFSLSKPACCWSVLNVNWSINICLSLSYLEFLRAMRPCLVHRPGVAVAYGYRVAAAPHTKQFASWEIIERHRTLFCGPICHETFSFMGQQWGSASLTELGFFWFRFKEFSNLAQRVRSSPKLVR